MKRVRLSAFAATMSVASVFVAGTAFAAQNVANTSQKGSLLVWPLISVVQDGGVSTSTLIEISNDATVGIHVECMYVNERKGRVNFDFHLTAKQTVSWDVWSQEGDRVSPPPFPSNRGNPGWSGHAQRGELVCFATDPGREFQVAWNHLTGTATVTRSSGSSSQPNQAFKYNAWAFSARSQAGLARDNQRVSHGKPGELRLTGANADGVYDACPAYNIANFMPNGANLGNVTTIDNHLAVVSCNIDLRETYRIHATKLEFTVWNSFEHSFTGAHICVDSIVTVALNDGNRQLTAGSNFEHSTLKTPNARFQVRGVKASPPCRFRTEISGLLGVLASPTEIDQSTGTANTLVGNTLHGAGLLPGYVLWDPSAPVPTNPRG